MGLRDDLLTWQGIRALAQCEAANLASGETALVVMDPHKAPLKGNEAAYMASSVPYAPTAGDVVFARVAWRSPWRQSLLRHVQAPVVLVSAFHDPTIKDTAAAELFVAGSPIQRFFGVQAMTTHPQVTAMPVGVEGAMVPTLQAAEARTERDILLYLNFQTTRTYENPQGQRILEDFLRTRLWQQFSGQSWVVADPFRPDNPAHYASQLGRAQFVLSPPRFGWDCYRTYEAIAMGAIPIVKRKPPITDVCEALPVLVVDDWAEVTEDRLRRAWVTRKPVSTETLTLSYWRQQIQHAARACVEVAA